ncbi:uncharacterized protein [Globicephala melas]|uniref:uncharacterized protein isoform X2 n=1 Tax=Globicephala melas TaxID=9731 RepID=UPI0038735C2A
MRRLQVSASGATESTHPGQGGRSGRDPAGVPGEAFQRKRSCRLTCKVVTAARPCAAAFVKICSSHPLSRGTVQFMATPLLANYSYFCQPVDDSQSLFILRKKPEQLTFLHVYLHGPVLLNGLLRRDAKFFGPCLHVPVLWAGRSGALPVTLPVVEATSYRPAAGEKDPLAPGASDEPWLLLAAPVTCYLTVNKSFSSLGLP